MAKNKISNRRGFERLKARNGVMAFFNNVKVYGQIADISLGGVSFFYFHTEKSPYPAPRLRPNGFIDIIYGKKDFSLRKITARVISDKAIGSACSSGKIVTKRRCSLKFKELTRDQLFLLKRFLLTCTQKASCYQPKLHYSLPLKNGG